MPNAAVIRRQIVYRMLVLILAAAYGSTAHRMLFLILAAAYGSQAH